MHIRYTAAACQTDLPNPIARQQMRANTDRMLSMIDSAVAGARPFLPVRLVVFPEFAHAAPVFATVDELLRKLTVPIPNEHTERLTAKAREHGIYIQSGSMLEEDPKWPGVVFNATCLIGPEGILYRYRKVNPWIPYEVHSSPHDLAGYDEPLFPVADTPIGRIGCAICYDWLFPEAIRQLAANGAEVLVRVSAYMDPWGSTEPMNWWTLVNRTRAIENLAYVVAANQGASLRHYPPYSWPGGSQVVDFDGRMLAEASPGPGERIVTAPIDISALRHERESRVGHHMLAHLRTEAYDVYRAHFYPPPDVEGARRPAVLSYEENVRLVGVAKRAWATMGAVLALCLCVLATACTDGGPDPLRPGQFQSPLVLQQRLQGEVGHLHIDEVRYRDSDAKLFQCSWPTSPPFDRSAVWSCQTLKIGSQRSTATESRWWR